MKFLGKAIEIIQKNIEKTHLEEKTRIVKNDFSKTLELLNKQNNRFDIIFIDPPYRSNYDILAINSIMEKNLLTQDGIIVIETDEDEKIEQIKQIKSIFIEDIRKYGRVRLVIAKGVK